MALAAILSLQQTLDWICRDMGHDIAIHPNGLPPYNFLVFWLWATKFQARITAFYPKLLDEEQLGLIILPDDIATLREIHEEIQINFREFEYQIRDSAHQEGEFAARCTSDMLCPLREFQNLLKYLQPFTEHLDFFVERLNELVLQTALEYLVQEAKMIKIDEKAENIKTVVPLATTTPSASETHGDEIVVGIEEEVRKIKHLILGEPSSRLEIISIVGMGGIGKTTLARTIYRDNIVLQHFDVRTWITVSQIYDARDILLSLLNAGKEENQEFSDEELGIEVYKSLKYRRYLIIVDDIWNTYVWDDIKKLLPDDCNGSRVVVTTRQTDVAIYANSYIYDMPLMDKDTSWNLLKKVAFPGDNCPLELADIGINIAEKCHGLPLTIVVIAGLLQVNQTRASWENIANDVKLLAMSKNDEHHVLDILSLSYDHLPAWLQPCLLYFARFPEDHKISVSNLIMLWMAEGFLEPNLVQTGYECLEDLIRRNLVSANRKRRNGLPNKCFVHDIIREMCIKLSHGIPNPRDILFLSNGEALYFTDQQQRLEEGYESLRVLDAPLDEKEELPCHVSQVCELVNLRYLALHSLVDFVIQIPANICMFANLESLIIHCKDNFSVRLPPEIWEIPKLRHLIIGGGMLDYFESEAALPIESLETLLQIELDNSSAGILKRIPSIRKLGVLYFNLVPGWMHYIKHLVHLESLYMEATLAEDYYWPQNFIFPNSLRKLTMYDVKLPWIDVGRILGSLPNLEVVKLKRGACQGRVWETAEGHFLKLKILEVEDSDLEIWSMDSSSHFPQLEHVKLSYCWNLKELPWCMVEVDTLQLIEVAFSSKNVDEWAEAIFEQQRDEGNELFQLRRSVPQSRKQTLVGEQARMRLVIELAHEGKFKVNLMGEKK